VRGVCCIGVMRDGHARGVPSFAQFARFDASAWWAGSGLPSTVNQQGAQGGPHQQVQAG
jgi:hypothetical protein